MPVCGHCGEDQFDVVDGLFYCSFCMTQSQHALEEQMDIDEVPLQQNINLTIRQRSTRTREKKVKYKGRPWEFHEGLTIIFKGQIKALIQLGADPVIEEVALRLWVLYLRQRGIAFFGGGSTEVTTEDNQSAIDSGDTPSAKRRKVAPPPKRARDQYIGTIEDPMTKPIRRKASARLQLAAHSSVTSRGLRTLAADGESDEEAEKEDQWQEDEDEALMNALIEHEVLKMKKKSSNKDRESDIEYSDENSVSSLRYDTPLAVLLALCTLCIKYTNPLVIPADIVRWTKLGRIPYCLSHQLLPDSMKLSYNDIHAFTQTDAPSPSSLTARCRKLVKMLQLTDFPTVDICLLASRFIFELELPGELHAIVHRMIERASPRTNYAITEPGYGQEHISAIAFIIISLKLLLGLNDHTEQELSRHAKCLMESLPASQSLFIWTDWVMFTQKRLHKAAESMMAESIGAIRTRETVTSLVEAIDSAKGAKSQQIGTSVQERCRQETQEELKRPLSHLLKQMQVHKRQTERSKSAAANHVASGSQSLLFEGSTMESDFGFSEDEMSRDISSMTPKDSGFVEDRMESCFRKTSLLYITDTEQFLKTFNPHGLSEFTVTDSATDSDDTAASPSTATPSHDLAVSENTSQTARMKIRKSQRAVREALKTANVIQPQNIDITNDSELLDSLGKAHEEYWSQTMKEDNYPLSYLWLLEVCSNMVGCTVTQLARHVRSRELPNVIKAEDLKGPELALWHNVKSMFFNNKK